MSKTVYCLESMEFCHHNDYAVQNSIYLFIELLQFASIIFKFRFLAIKAISTLYIK